MTADMVEELGSEIHIIFAVDTPPVRHAALSEAAAAPEDDSTIVLASGESLWTARVAARSRIQPGHRLHLGVDTSNLHYFDPASGDSVGLPHA